MYLIKSAKILIPDHPQYLKTLDVLIDQNGRLKELKKNIIKDKKHTPISGKNIILTQGLIDTFFKVNDPGHEEIETIEESISKATLGGFTGLMPIPETQPKVDTHTMVEYFTKKNNGLIDFYPIGAATKNLEGSKLAELYDMYAHGAKGFSDGYNVKYDNMLLLKALQYLKSIDGMFIHYCSDASLQSLGYMHEGKTSTRIGMSGIPEIAEHISIQNALTIAHYAESKIHLSGISTAKSVAMIKDAKKKNKNITCSVAWHNLLWTDEALAEYDSLYKVLPPLRTEKDRQSLIAGIKDGTIDMISSYHNPQNWDRKNIEFAYASYGMSTISKIFSGLLTLGKPEEWIQCLTTNPRKIFSINDAGLEVGEEVNISIFDTEAIADQEPESAAINKPFHDKELKGKTLMVVNNGKVKNYVS